MSRLFLGGLVVAFAFPLGVAQLVARGSPPAKLGAKYSDRLQEYVGTTFGASLDGLREGLLTQLADGDLTLFAVGEDFAELRSKNGRVILIPLAALRVITPKK